MKFATNDIVLINTYLYIYINFSTKLTGKDCNTLRVVCMLS